MNSPRWDLYQLLLMVDIIVVDNIIGIIIINYYSLLMSKLGFSELFIIYVLVSEILLNKRHITDSV